MNYPPAMKLSQAADGPLLVLAEFGAWWTAQMRSLMPAFLRGGDGKNDALLIAIDRLDRGGALNGTILLRERGSETIFRALGADRTLPAMNRGLATGLRLPPGSVLTRDVVLPLAAARR
jgi:hypothetical protein